MMISLISLSVCTSATKCSRSSSITSPGLTGARSKQRGAARQHVDLAGELPRSIYRDERLARTGRQNNFEPTCLDDEEWHDLLSHLDEHLSGVDRTNLAKHTNPFHLIGC